MILGIGMEKELRPGACSTTKAVDLKSRYFDKYRIDIDRMGAIPHFYKN